MRTQYWSLIAFIGSLFAAHAALAAPAAVAEAESVLNEYCHALAAGDTETLRALMGGDYLKEKEELLNDTAYPDFLRSRYAGAKCEVSVSTSVQEGGEQVEGALTIQLGEGDVVETRFRLGRVAGAGQLRLLEELAEASE